MDRTRMPLASRRFPSFSLDTAPSLSLSLFAAKVLHIRLTDDQDPFFLYTMDMDETDFASYVLCQPCVAACGTWCRLFGCCASRSPRPVLRPRVVTPPCPPFRSVKRTQDIHVDFMTFPRDLAALLERCAARGEARGSSAFECHLRLEADPVFSVVECNAFKNLTHLSLRCALLLLLAPMAAFPLAVTR